jgi:flagellar protein FliL
MADEEELEEGQEEGEGEEGKKSGGTMKLVIIVNAVVLVLALIGGGAWFFMSGDDSEGGGDAADAEVLAEGGEGGEEVEVRRGTPIYVPLHPAFVVNFENQEKVSFLQVDIQIMTFDSKVETALKVHMPIVRNELLLLLGGKQYHEINTREGKRNLSQEAIREIQRVLDEAGAPSTIEALYFTSFVMQ